uniref:RNA polymerase-associated protein CTR9 homolog n=1 Tax=Acrobeloides nanus TaxID=290746 RepID=A0A914EKH2_9BILA
MSQKYIPKDAISIPLKHTAEDEVIEISFEDELPDGEEVLQILKGERAALHYWIDVSLEYYRRGNVIDFCRILELSGGDASLDYQDYEKDQMRALDLLAAFYVLQGNKERNKEKKKEWFTKATLLYTTADKIIMYELNHLLGRAYFCLLEGNKMDQADAQFTFVLNQNDTNIPAMMGKACISFGKKQTQEYKLALFYYKKCLKLNPNCPADVRVGMGYCLAKLGKYEKARMAFERALDLDPHNVQAIIAMAILDMNSGEPARIKHGIKSFSRAYQLEPENPMVLNHLANHFFFKDDLDKVEQLAWHAFQLTENEAMRAESCFQLARCFHKKEDYDRAFRYYYQATQFNHPKFVLPLYGLGQIYIHREDYDNAIITFEKILKITPNNFETLKVLGSLYAHSDHGDSNQITERREKAREILKKVIDMYPDDVETLIELAQLEEQHDPQNSLKIYLKLIHLLKEGIGADVPAEVLNNVGSLYFALGEYEKSKDYFDEARNFLLAEGENLNEETSAMYVTISYNLARSYEVLCLYDKAENLYKSILRHRNYMDCFFRIGCLMRDRGDIHGASVLFKEAMADDPRSATAWTLLGNMHMAKDEWGPAQKVFDLILKQPENKDDVYSIVSLGNIWMETLFSSRTKEEPDRMEKNRERAMQMYVKALKTRPRNIWAAHGIGCLLAQRGEFLEARDIFSQIREATADFPDVWLNIAHIYMELKQYVSAVQMYKNCMVKFNRHTDINLLLYIARAYWRAGKLEDCRDWLEKSLIEAPDNLMIKYNHAVLLQRMATKVLQEEKSTLSAVTGAVEDLKTAERIFTDISTASQEIMLRYRYLSRTACGNEARACDDLLKQAKTYLQRAQAKDDEERKQKERQEEERLALLRQKVEEERLRREEKERELEELKQMRQHFVEKTKEILRLPQIVEDKKGRGGGGGGRKRREERDEFVNDSSDMGDWVGQPGEERPKKEKKDKSMRKRREHRARSMSSDDGFIVDDPRRLKKLAKKQKLKHKRPEDVPARLKGKVKSKAYVSTTESESSEEDVRVNLSDEFKQLSSGIISDEEEAEKENEMDKEDR